MIDSSLATYTEISVSVCGLSPGGRLTFGLHFVCDISPGEHRGHCVCVVYHQVDIKINRQSVCMFQFISRWI